MKLAQKKRTPRMIEVNHASAQCLDLPGEPEVDCDYYRLAAEVSQSCIGQSEQRELLAVRKHSCCFVALGVSIDIAPQSLHQVRATVWRCLVDEVANFSKNVRSADEALKTRKNTF